MLRDLEFMKNLAYKAGQIMTKANKEKNFTIHDKEQLNDYATSADLEVEQLIMEHIRASFPNDTILSEESSKEVSSPLSADYLWVIDPIDGTHNFSHGRNYSCVSIALAQKGTLLLGACYNPFTDELYWAEKGKGSFLNDQRIAIGQKNNLQISTIMTDPSYADATVRRHLQMLLKLDYLPFILIRGSAALAMCEVAAGQADIYFHTSLHPWDNAAAFLIIQEAGGVARNSKGEAITFLSPDILVGNEMLVKQVVTSFSKIS